MNFHVSKRYLVLPVSYAAKEKRVLFYHNTKLVLDLMVRLDRHCPDTYQYMDMDRFFGEELTLKIEPEMNIRIEQTDVPDMLGLYQEKYRPVAHFSASRGWINDPNGLVQVNGVYHMFFQYNPAGTDWGNMHWGHAVSTDLMHWQEMNIALFPDETGTMFSGSGIEDVFGLTGLKETDQKAILLFYTAAGGTSKLSEGKTFTQCMAYSADGGRTFHKYAKNPLIKETVEGNRDPKVVYHPERQFYYLALFLKDNRYALYASKDLLQWTWQQELILPEDSECPDLYPLCLEGGKEIYWVFSGASDRYLIGRFNAEGQFKPIQTVKRLHYGTNSYAAQTFSGISDGRTIRISWNTSRIPGTPFNCAMCTPTEMRLRFIQNEFRLCAMPVSEIKTLYANHWETEETVVEKGSEFTCPLSGKAQDIRICLTFHANTAFRLTLLGIEFHLNPLENRMKCKDSIMPLFLDDQQIKLRIVTDTNAVEVYTNQGEAFLCVEHVADYNLDKLILLAEDNDLIIREIKIDTLCNIWDKMGVVE